MSTQSDSFSTTTVNVPYSSPQRSSRGKFQGGIRWNVEVDDSTMQDRAEVLMLLDPALPQENVADFVLSTWGNFLCRHCGFRLVFNGGNGSRTRSLLCNRCRHRMCIWNTFELTIWGYKKAQMALLHYTHGESIKSSGTLHGIGKDALNEMKMCLPDIKYSRQGSIERIEYCGKEYGIVTSDMMYKGQKGVMLGVSGGVEFTEFGNENTGEGLDAFFDEVEKRVDTENYIFIMDKRLNVAKMILERWKERTIVVLQSHSIWGDVSVCFYRDGWHTLRLRTDTFSTPSKKRNEEALLSVGEIELFEGLLGVRTTTSLHDITERRLKRKIEELLIQVANVDWTREGRVDIIMQEKLRKLNGLFTELRRRKIDIEEYLCKLRTMIEELIVQFGLSIKRSVKKKIVNAWRAMIIMKEDVNRLSERLLNETLVSKTRKKISSEQKKTESGLVKFFARPRLIYRGKMDDHSVPPEAQWILGLLKEIFNGKEITNNPCEGRFGVIGMQTRLGRSIYLDRAITKVFLQKQEVGTTINWLVEKYPISDMGKRGERRSRVHLKVGKRYTMTYANYRKEKSVRTVDIVEKKRKYFTAFCHLRGEELTFRRSRVKSIMAI